MDNDRLTTVFYAAVNPDGTHGELKKLGEGVVNISMSTMDEAVVDSFTKYLTCATLSMMHSNAQVIAPDRFTQTKSSTSWNEYRRY